MPFHTEWVPPEIMVETPQGTIYHAYKDDEADHMLTCWFSTSDAGEWEFDIRELPAYLNWLDGVPRDEELILKAAAAAGEIRFPPDAPTGG